MDHQEQARQRAVAIRQAEQDAADARAHVKRIRELTEHKMDAELLEAQYKARAAKAAAVLAERSLARDQSERGPGPSPEPVAPDSILKNPS